MWEKLDGDSYHRFLTILGFFLSHLFLKLLFHLLLGLSTSRAVHTIAQQCTMRSKAALNRGLSCAWGGVYEERPRCASVCVCVCVCVGGPQTSIASILAWRAAACFLFRIRCSFIFCLYFSLASFSATSASRCASSSRSA